MKVFAGDRKKIHGGHIVFVSPKPLPTGAVRYYYGDNVSFVNNCFLEFGGINSSEFAWQAMLALPVWFVVFLSVVLPALVSGLASIIGGFEFGHDTFLSLIRITIPIAIVVSVIFSIYSYSLISKGISRKAKSIPVRFNRQRREVCFVPEVGAEPIFTPWEDLVAWVMDAQGITEYGVHKVSGYGFIFVDPKTGKDYSLEYESMSTLLALGSWEAVRSYMEYGLASDISASETTQNHDDGFRRGVQDVDFFYRRKQAVLKRYNNGEIGLFWLIGWYLYRLASFWTLPNKMVEWELSEIERLKVDNIPRSMKDWSKSIPKEKWATPSDGLVYQSDRVIELANNNPNVPIYEIFEKISRSDCP